MRTREIKPRPLFGGMKRQRFLASLERMEPRQLLTTFVVTTTADNNDPGSLRYAINQSNLTTTGANNIDFAIPAAVQTPTPTQPYDVAFPGLDPSTGLEKFPGFDPATQDWTIALQSPLPAITHQVTIDGYSQAQTGVPFAYPNQSQYQTLSLSSTTTGGTFTLTTSAPLPVGTTVPLPFDATAAQVQTALQTIVGTAAGNVSVTGSTNLPPGTYNIYFRGAYDGLNIQPLTTTSALVGTGDTLPTSSITEIPATTPTLITSSTSTVAALDGNNALPRVIIEGSGMDDASGFDIDASDTNLRGLIIDGFGIGVAVQAGVFGAVIQGNDIGQYPVFPVNTETGAAVTGPGSFAIDGQGNSLQGVLLASTNTTVGGVETQDANVIIGNGEQGVSVLPGAHGNQILGNQIGIDGPTSTSGLYTPDGNGSDGVLIADSSNDVGGVASGSGNLISGNGGDGVDIIGTAATSNNVLGNYIGAGPGGGYILGSGDPGNAVDGVAIDNASDNQIGGSTAAAQNVISSNGVDGVHIFDSTGGTSAIHNMVQGNIIGLTADGLSVLGNSQTGVAIYSEDNTVDDTNIISTNLQGILLSGAGATGNLINGNLIGTNGTGNAKLGNAEEGVRIDGAPNNTISGNAKGSQVISGNNVGLLITGTTATGNQVFGNFIGTDITGTLDLGNSVQGVEIDDAPANTIGGSTATDLNLISANLTGVEIVGAQALSNVVQGNNIGTDITGKLPLGNEQDGVYIHEGASSNMIGGSTAAAGNIIAFNSRDGVRIADDSVGNSILSNSIFANLGSGIDLVSSGTPATSPNNLQAAPTLTSVATSVTSTIINGTLTSTPNSTFTIQFFGSAVEDPTGLGEGGQYLGQVTAVTGPNGIATYSANLASLLQNGQFVTATATNSAGDTSEFSAPLTQIFGTVQFQMTDYTVNEGVGTATIVATRTGGSGGYFTVNYATADGTAIAGTNYQAASGTLTFNPGVDSQSFTVTIDDNGLPSADTSLSLNLSDPVGPIVLGPQSSATLNILGNQPGSIQFLSSSIVTPEAAGTASFTVYRQIAGTIASVNYTTGGGTAIPGVDYTPTSGTLTFSQTALSETITVPILINPNIQGDVTVDLTLSSPTNGSTIGNPSFAVLKIQPAVYQFQAPSYSIDQAGGSATISVTRSSDVGTTSVNYSTSNGTAVAGVDYVPTSGTLTFSPGQSVASFTVPILINPNIQGNETINVSLSSPAGGAIVGSPSTVPLIIIDDGVDRHGPDVTSVKAIAGPRGVAEVVVTFNEALDPTTAVNLLNYGYSVRTANSQGKLGKNEYHLIGIRSATYNPNTFTVTLPLTSAVKVGMPLEIQLNAATNVASAGVGISDLLGNLLDGNDDGFPGSSFTANVVAKPAPKPTHSTASKKPVDNKVKATNHAVKISSVKSHPGGPAKTHATTPARRR
jgi:Calx-beta domain